MNILLLSDTHSYMDSKILQYAESADEIWHAGDIGDVSVANALEKTRPIRAVYGNIDDKSIQHRFPEHQIFSIEGVKVWMTHIGGYPPKYAKGIKAGLKIHRPDLFICGHSHILKVIPDKERQLLHMNPGAVGQQGFHHIRTMLRFSIKEGKILNLEVVELGKRGRILNES